MPLRHLADPSGPPGKHLRPLADPSWPPGKHFRPLADPSEPPGKHLRSLADLPGRRDFGRAEHGCIASVAIRDILPFVEGTDFDERRFFSSIAQSGARTLLIGRRALVALGLPVLTADYDFWVHPDDVARFNRAVEAVGLLPTHTPEEARTRGRYVLENDEHVDVLAARSFPMVDGVAVAFDDVWGRRQTLHLDPGTPVTIPSLADLILTKRFASRPKDIEDIRLLQTLLATEREP